MAIVNKILNPLRYYGTNPELDKLVDSTNVSDRLKAVAGRYGLERLVNDASLVVRAGVATTGFYNTVLITDSSEYVRNLAKGKQICG